MSKYKTIIGLELHCELITNSKVFSPSRNSYCEVPNSNVNEIDMSFPGIMPYLNKEAVKKALKMSMVLGCTQPDELVFDRKNYFNPDLPKGYQITQVTKPVGINGHVELISNGKPFVAEIHDIHLEEDTASLDHYDFFSLIDYNRAGVPLIEIVTTPCFEGPDEVVEFLEYLTNSLKYCGISEADTKKGQIRCDVNVNLKNDAGEYVTPKVEIKNINSFSNVANAIKYETYRQNKALEEGLTDELCQETRRYDETTNTTIRMRKKEGSIDYKYFVEPNIPRIKIDPSWLEEIRSEIPSLPNERLKTYMEKYGLSEYDGKILVRNKDISDYFNKCLFLGVNPKTASNWITTEIMSVINKENINIKDLFLTPERLLQIVKALESNMISSKQAKELFALTLKENEEPNVLIEKYGMKQLDNDDELETIIKNILDNNASQIEAYWSGKTNMFDYFVGQTMKETRGKANPVKAKEIITRELETRK